MLDFETCLDEKSESNKVFAGGIKVYNSKPVLFYIDVDKDSTRLVLNVVDEMLRNKYSKTSFYCHNLSKYDIIFQLKVLVVYNESVSENEHYHIKVIFRSSDIIGIKISKTILNTRHSVTIKDSYTILTFQGI